MNPTFLTRALRELAGIVTGMSVVSSAGLVCGGVCCGVADALGRNPYLWFLIGFFVASGLLSLLLASSWVMVRRLRRIKQLQTEGVITQREAARLRRALLDWYSERMSGHLGTEELDDSKPVEPPPVPPA